MFCPFCGKEIPDGSKFCGYCGKTIDASAQPSQPAMGGQQGMQPPTQNVKTVGTSIFKNKKAVTAMIAGAAAIVVLIVAFVVVSSLPKKVNVLKDFNITFSGSDGYGVMEFDNSMINYDLRQRRDQLGDSYYTASNSKRRKISREMDNIRDVLSATNCEIQDEQGNAVYGGSLSNGDKIKVACTVNSEVYKRAGYRATGTEKTFTVSGLTPVQEIDPFDGVTVEWDVEDGIRLKVDGPEQLVDGVTVNYEARETDDGANVTAYFDRQSLLNAGYVVNEENMERVYPIGRKPVEVTDFEPQEVKDAVRPVLDAMVNEEADTCNWELLKSGNPVSIDSLAFKEFRSSWGSIIGRYIAISGEDEYTKDVSVKVYRMADNTLKVMKGSTKTSCTVNWSSWD